jgi:hypothetical protein
MKHADEKLLRIITSTDKVYYKVILTKKDGMRALETLSDKDRAMVAHADSSNVESAKIFALSLVMRQIERLAAEDAKIFNETTIVDQDGRPIQKEGVE